MVSLPSKWVKQNSLDKGSEIELDATDDNSIIIKVTEGKTKIKEARIKLTTSVESSIRTIITNVYRLGYDKVHITFNQLEDINTIKKIISNYLLGYELTDIKPETCIIENITEPSSEHADKVLLKVLFGISEIINSVEELMNGKNNLEHIKEMEEKVQQYDNFIRRTQSKDPTNRVPLQWIFHNQLIHSQREVFLIAKYLEKEKKKIKISKDTKELYKELKRIYETLKEGYMKKDIKILESIHELEKKMIYETSYKVLKKSTGDDNIINYRIASAIRNFYLCSSPLLGILLWNEN